MQKVLPKLSDKNAGSLNTGLPCAKINGEAQAWQTALSRRYRRADIAEYPWCGDEESNAVRCQPHQRRRQTWRPADRLPISVF